MSLVQFSVKCLTGVTYNVKLSNSATGLELKSAIQKEDKDLFPYLQRLIVGSSKGKKWVTDEAKLSDCGIEDGSVVKLIVLVPFKLYLQGKDGKLYEITIPSSEPEDYTGSALYTLVEEKVGHKLDNNLFYRGKYLTRSDTRSLSQLDIKKETTMIIVKDGIVISANNPTIDICFLMDCTGSMQKYIDAVKNNIVKLRDGLVEKYKSCDLQFSFVRYTDFDVPHETKTTYLDFTSDTEAFLSFVGKIIADGGGDRPEDVMGGFKVVFNALTWRSESNKVLIHIADSTCHGTAYHDFNDDTYHDGDPNGITHESMMQKVVDLNIQYWFGYIHKQITKKMIDIFNESLQFLSDKHSLIRQFDAKQTTDIGCSVMMYINDVVDSSMALKQVSPSNPE